MADLVIAVLADLSARLTWKLECGEIQATAYLEQHVSRMPILP